MTENTPPDDAPVAEKTPENAAVTASPALPQEELNKLTDDIIAGLKTVYDPEIPVNIVDLGLIYSCQITEHELGGKKIDVKMSMTAPGCGMGNVLKADVESKLSRVPEVKQVDVQVVFEPPWNPGLMSEAAKLQLGFDLDYGSSYADMSK